MASAVFFFYRRDCAGGDGKRERLRDATAGKTARDFRTMDAPGAAACALPMRRKKSGAYFLRKSGDLLLLCRILSQNSGNFPPGKIFPRLTLFKFSCRMIALRNGFRSGQVRCARGEAGTKSHRMVRRCGSVRARYGCVRQKVRDSRWSRTLEEIPSPSPRRRRQAISVKHSILCCTS